MNSLRELTRSPGKECSVRRWATVRQISFPLSLRQVMNAYAPPKLRGFADLHAHPASHLAFGASDQGTGGPFYGDPNYWDPSKLSVEAATINIAKDLAPCDGLQHSPTGFDVDPKKCDIDPVRVLHRFAIMFGIEKNVSHNSNGSPTFESWPGASSKSHQQMHISFIHRAWQGGLRLMIASVTDNQLLSRLWNSGFGFNYPAPISDFDYNSARRQFEFIQTQATNNSTWMEIVKTSAEAREAVSNNKLAVILGVEMDRLTADRIIDLKNEFGVCQVVPIHLANNSFGAVAIYDNQFNTNNWYLNNGKCLMPTDIYPQLDLFFKVELDPNLKVEGDPSKSFKLGPPSYLLQVTPAALSLLPAAIAIAGPLGGVVAPLISLSLAFIGAVLPLPVDDNAYSLLGYKVQEGQEGGHRNRFGLNKPELFKLMKAGFIIDLAHMSEYSQIDALDLADPIGYPLMNSHTGMRPRDGKTSERDMPKNLVERLTSKGGVIGTSTAGYRDDNENPTGNQMEQWIKDYYGIWNAMKFRGVALGTDFNGMSPQIPPDSSLTVRYDDNPSSPDPTKIKKFSIGTRTFDLTKDGLAHYGMLPDFIQALRQFDPDLGADIADHFLFRTAEDTINMWERVEEAAKNIP